MEFSINAFVLIQALNKIKSALQTPSFIKIKVSKNIVLASEHEGYSVVIKLDNAKIKSTGNITLDFNIFSQVVKSNSEITFKGDDTKLDFEYGKCKGSINSLEEISFQHKTSDSLFELDSKSTLIFDYLDVLTLKDIKFGLDDAPISIDIESKNKILELSSATHSEAVLLSKKLKTSSNLSTALSPKILKRIKALVGKNNYKIALTESTLFIEFIDKVTLITFTCPLPEAEVTSTENIKYLKRKQLDSTKNFITVESKDLADYFSKLKAIVEPNNSIEMSVSKKGLNVIFTTSKGKVSDTLPSNSKSYKTDDTIFLIDYDLMQNNLSKLHGKIILYFCSKSLWIETEKDDTKIFIMVSLL